MLRQCERRRGVWRLCPSGKWQLEKRLVRCTGPSFSGYAFSGSGFLLSTYKTIARSQCTENKYKCRRLSVARRRLGRGWLPQTFLLGEGEGRFSSGCLHLNKGLTWSPPSDSMRSSTAHAAPELAEAALQNLKTEYKYIYDYTGKYNCTTTPFNSTGTRRMASDGRIGNPLRCLSPSLSLSVFNIFLHTLLHCHSQSGAFKGSLCLRRPSWSCFGLFCGAACRLHLGPLQRLRLSSHAEDRRGLRDASPGSASSACSHTGTVITDRQSKKCCLLDSNPRAPH